MEINLKELNSKEKLLAYFQDNFDEMYAANYYELIDVITFIKNDLNINFVNSNCYSDLDNLKEVFEIITNENNKISYTIDA